MPEDDDDESVFEPAYQLTSLAREHVNAGRFSAAADAFEIEGDAWELAGRADVGNIARRDAARYRLLAAGDTPQVSEVQK